MTPFPHRYFGVDISLLLNSRRAMMFLVIYMDKYFFGQSLLHIYQFSEYVICA